MHVQRPGKIADLRDLAVEIAIIVVAVLIALVGEQIVQTLRGVAQAKQAEAALQQELQESANAISERRAVDACLQQQLLKLRAAATTSSMLRPRDVGDRRRVIGDLYQTPWRSWTQGRWVAAVSSGVLNHLPNERLGAYASMFKAVQDIDATIRNERAAKGDLALLQMADRSEAERGRLLATLTNLDRDRVDILVVGGDFLESAARLGVRPTSGPDANGSAFFANRRVCRPVGDRGGPA